MNTLINDGRFKAFEVKSVNVTIICDVVLCSLADIYQHFRGLYCLCLEGNLKMDAVNSSKMVVYLHLTRRCHVADDNDDDSNNDDDDDSDDNDEDDNNDEDSVDDNNKTTMMTMTMMTTMSKMTTTKTVGIQFLFF
jgi:hypothetical protein